MAILFILNLNCNMRNRINILNDLVCFNESLTKLQDELSKHPWDAKESILIITKVHLSNILKKCINNNITVSDLENWANTIECRDDLDFEDEELQEVIFELASPEINGKIIKEQLQKIIEKLSQ